VCLFHEHRDHETIVEQSLHKAQEWLNHEMKEWLEALKRKKKQFKTVKATVESNYDKIKRNYRQEYDQAKAYFQSLRQSIDDMEAKSLANFDSSFEKHSTWCFVLMVVFLCLFCLCLLFFCLNFLMFLQLYHTNTHTITAMQLASII